MKKYSLKVNGHDYDVTINDVNEASTVAHVTVNGTEYEVEIEGGEGAKAKKPQVAPVPSVASNIAVTPTMANPSKPAQVSAGAANGHTIKSPLPGTVLAVKVNVGDKVTAGQTVAVLEAMKMENEINADRTGVIKAVCVQQGATVMEGDNLIVIE